MQKEMFEKMALNLDNLVQQANEIKNKIPSKEAFSNLTIKEAISYVGKAQTMQAKQDKLFKNELYHVIGMGDLTPTQEMVFLKLIRMLGDTRSYIKAIAGYKINPVPGIPAKADYNCETLGINLNKQF